jgi:hypothetical protein
MKGYILPVTARPNSPTDCILCSPHITTFDIHSVLLNLKYSDRLPDWHDILINAVRAENAQQMAIFTNRTYKNKINTKNIKLEVAGLGNIFSVFHPTCQCSALSSSYLLYDMHRLEWNNTTISTVVSFITVRACRFRFRGLSLGIALIFGSSVRKYKG